MLYTCLHYYDLHLQVLDACTVTCSYFAMTFYAFKSLKVDASMAAWRENRKVRGDADNFSKKTKKNGLVLKYHYLNVRTVRTEREANPEFIPLICFE